MSEMEAEELNDQPAQPAHSAHSAHSAHPGQAADAEHDRQAQPVDQEEPPRLPFPVVGIGASAGGLEAFIEFFSTMPPDSGMAFVLIQHLPPDRESMIAELVGKRTPMPVRQVAEGIAVEPNHVYVIRPGHTLTIHDGKLRLGEDVGKPRHTRPVDDFFKSLAEEQRERAVCIVMSGMGSNGAAGAQAIKAVGGLCIAQDPESAKFPSMPRALIDAGYADYILPPPDMPDVLLGYARHPYAQQRSDPSETLAREQQQVREILAVLRTRTKQDFNGYKKPTVLRRIQRRMGLNRLTRIADYAKLLRQSPVEVTGLADDLLIHVTGFFRDPDAWEALRKQVIVPLIATRESDTSLRCWVSACSSGEEAYSLAMLLLEEAERANKTFDIKVFATDMAERSLGNARVGLYPGGIEAEMPPERLDRFFTRENAMYRVKHDLRECVVFAPQNILQDAPFSKLDIATCRNLLIYLEPEVQHRVLALLHFGLRHGGALFLGSSETVAGTEKMFEVVDKKARIFRRVGPTRHGAVPFPALPVIARPERTAENRPAPRPSIAQLTNHALLTYHVPAAVTVDRDLHVVYFHGNTHPYLNHPTGEPTRDVLALAKDHVRGAVRGALHKAMAQSTPASMLDGFVVIDGLQYRVLVTASPLEAKQPPEYFVVSFERRIEPQRPPAALPATEGDGNGNGKGDGNGKGGVKADAVSELEGTDELRRLRDELQSTIEELQTSNEEHKAAAEEVMSMNEELQSSNEELETSKEEMQSLNEELTTVNAQLQAKMEELQSASNDMASLLSSTDIAVIFLDPNYRIRRYTPAARKLLDFIEADIGRPIRDLSRKFTDPALMDDVVAVMDQLQPREREVPAENGRVYLRRVLPYRTTDNRINGVVMLFIDITERRRISELLAEQTRLLDLSNDAIIVRDVNNRIIYWNHGASEMYGYRRDEAMGKDFHTLLKTEAEIPLPELTNKLEQTDRVSGEVTQVTRDGRRVSALCRWALDRDADGKPGAILTSLTDISEAKRLAAAGRQSEEQFRLMVESVRGFAIFMMDPHGQITTWNTSAERMFGWTESEMLGRSSVIIFTPEDRAAGAFDGELATALSTGRALDERWHVRKNGERFWANGILSVVRGEKGELRGLVKILRDETPRKQTEDLLHAAKQTADNANQIKDEFLATLSHELRTPLSAILLWAKTLHSSKSPEMFKEGLESIISSAQSQARLIDDLLDSSRITAGKMRLELDEIDLAATVRSAVEAIEPALDAKRVAIVTDLGRSIGMVVADRDRLHQILWNLLTNAMKFTPSGGKITVSAKRQKDDVQLSVADTGVGIEPAFLPNVFDRFRQFEGALTRTHGGLGLGLTITKQLVELHGGSITAHSEGPGKGATFTVRLPLPPQGARRGRGRGRGRGGGGGGAQTRTSDRLRGVSILFIEDDRGTRNAITAILQGAGARVNALENPTEAIEAFKSARRDARPNLILSDIGLPEIDGYSLLQTIRMIEASDKTQPVPAVALTAYARTEDRQKALDAGYVVHLGKPIDPAKLLSTLASVVEK